MKKTQLLTILVVVAVLVGSVPGGVLALGATDLGSTSSTNEHATESNESATTGQQLATVIEVTDDEVRADVDDASLESALEGQNESTRAEILADRAATLREQANETEKAQREATAAYEADELSTSEYAQRLAVLASSANMIERGFDRLDERAESISTLELRAAGYDREANDAARDQLRKITSSGSNSLLAQYAGEVRGEFSVTLENGLSIEVENEDGERSRELERDQPGNGTFQVTQSEALEAASEPLADDIEGEWTLQSVDRDDDDGYFEFEFVFFGPEMTGEAEVNVDGETGEVFEFEEELEPRDDDDRDDDDERPLSISLVEGTAEPGANVTLLVTDSGEPVVGAPVELDDQLVGETDDDGRLTVTLPDDDDVDIEIEFGEREGELELRLHSQSAQQAEDEEISRNLAVDGSVDNGTVTVSVTYAGTGVEGITVIADGDHVGTTGDDGTLSFEATPTDDELEVTLVKGNFEAELEFEVGADGTLTLDDVDVEERDDDDRDDEDESEDDDDVLEISIVDGTPAPGATVTLEVTGDSGPVEGAVIELEDDYVGTTNADGRLTVTLPEDEDEVEFEAEHGDREGELELEFGDDAGDNADEDDADDDDADDDDADDDDSAEADDE